MKKVFLSLILFILTVTFTKAQDTLSLPEFGKVEVAELQMKDCSFSHGASAVNLLKCEQVELLVYPNGNTEVVTTTRYRTKIFNRNGYKKATVIIPYITGNAMKIKNIQAATYSLRNDSEVVITPVKDEDIFKDEGTKKDAHKSLKFTFPNIKEGSIIEYQFVTRFKMAFEIPSWYFQDDIPTALTVYRILRPFSNLKKRVVAQMPIEELHGICNTVDPSKKLLYDTYIAKNVPAFNREPFMSSSRDYIYRIDFLLNNLAFNQYTNPWSSTNLLLLRSSYFGGVFDSKIPGTKSIIDSVKRLNDVSSKVQSVYNYVKQKLKWDHVYSKYARDLDDVWKEGEGTSAEINLSILNLLRKCGIQCFPVLYSTRANGYVDYTFPDLSQFNTVNIAVINGKVFNLLDGTNPFLSYKTPPYNVVNRTGLLIDPVYFNKVNIDFDRRLIWDSISVSASLAANGVLTGEVVKKYFDLAKSIKLEEAEDNSNKNISEIEADIKIDTLWRENIENELLPLVEHSTFHYEMPATNNFYFLSPFLFSDISKNPFTAPQRISDIDFGASTASLVQIKIALPKGIKVEELAKNKEIYSPDSSVIFICRNEVKNDTLYITNSIEIKKPIFDKAGYGSLQKVFETIYSVLNSQILLQKKDEQ